MTPPTTTRRKVREGVVVSDKMDKTRGRASWSASCATSSYHKFRKRRARYKAHDETNRCASATGCASSRRGRCRRQALAVQAVLGSNESLADPGIPG